MNNSSPLRHLLLAALVPPLAGACADQATAPDRTAEADLLSPSAAYAPARSDFVPHLGTVRDCANLAVPLDPAALDPAALLCRTGPGTPVVDTDGQQLTLGQWIMVNGRLSIKCVAEGTLYTAHLSNLTPRGVYTAWNFVFVNGAFVAGGPLGTGDGSQNGFRASAAGEGQLSLIVPEGTAFPNGTPMPACGDLSSVTIIAAYHMDGQTHGPGPGPLTTQAFHAVSSVALD